MKGPKLNTAPKVWSHESHIEEDSHFPCHAGHIISDAGQDAIGLLDHLDTVVARASQHPVVLFCQATFQPLLSYQYYFMVVMTQVQHPGLTLVECSANDGDAWTQILSCMSQNFSRSQGKISVWFTAVGQQLLRKTTFSTCCFLGQGADHKIELTSMQETSTGLHLHYTTVHCAAAIGMTR